MPRVLTLALVAAVAVGCVPRDGRPPRAAPPREALRRTAYVEIFEACKGSIVKFTATRKERKRDDKGKTTTVTHTQWGSGCIVHPAGYVLTNSHMLLFEGTRVAETFDGKQYPVRLIAASDHYDLALMKLERAEPFEPLRLGRSAEALVGEPAITIGSPFGIRFTMATGIVSGVGRSTNTEHADLHGLLQATAAINPGSSGGPLLNILGELIGICVSSKRDAESIGFAIAIDQAIRVVPEFLSAEQRYGYVLGLTVSPEGAPVVAEVAKGSPAEAAGLRVGDLITHVGGLATPTALHYHLALIDRKGGQALPIRLVRGDATRTCSVTLGTVPLRPAEQVGDVATGLDYKTYSGSWSALPDFATLVPTATGTQPTVGLGEMAGKDAFGLELSGYLDVPRDGVYFFHLTSDDGSRLWIGDTLVVDNDGQHPAQERRGLIALRAGKHRLRVALFDSGGDEALALAWEGPGLRKQPIPAAALSRPKPPAKP